MIFQDALYSLTQPWKEFKKKSEEDINHLIHSLQALQRMSPREAQQNQTICQTKTVLRKKDPGDTPKLQKLKTELLAARLGIVSDKLTDPSFCQFAESTRLYNYLATYNHKLGYRNGEVMLGPEDNQKPWSEIKGLALNKLPHEKDEFVQPWHYGENGIQAVKDMYQWTEIEPYMHDNPSKWGGGYAYQLCTTAVKKPRLHGDHTYMRLCTPEGAIYSVGLYRPEKRLALEYYWLPLRVKRGCLMSPDVSDFWGVNVQVLTVAITKEEFEAKKKQIEEDNKFWMRFHPLHDNCTKWAIKITGFHLNCRYMAPRALVHHHVVELSDKHFHKLPQTVQKVCHYTMVFFFNMVSFIGGSFWVDSKMLGEKPHLGNLSDMISAEKLLVESPHKLGTEIIPMVEAWRKQRVAELKQNGASAEEIHDAQWGLPPEDWICSSSKLSSARQP